ncbi:TDT family transporter [Xanthomonas sp. WHRI 10064A]|uniref:TDT family transporter n=1 Tax=unclassified Xanthomonas TaxID=2643310 RepID=UPI002B23695F|nr:MULTISPECIES: TDT family transporter [unclassified Xanthomonas]MEA9587171.1 TDT family transporter [Xanthomonas sp. WHRI 10064B]MEA9616362.1 TDT family transporter [Xanthomonas sp. WHRI 10064A]
MSTVTALPVTQWLRPFKALSGPREVIRQFTPSWFAVTMGTGIFALALGQLPWPVPGLAAIGARLWMCNVALFVVFALLYAARWVLFFDEARRIFGHASASMFLGTIPMGLATIINGLLLYGLPRWGSAVLPLAEALWWADVAMAVACGVGVPYLMFTRQQHRIEQMTAVWLLPVVAAEVAAASGGLLAPHLADAGSRFAVLIASYALWAYSVPVAMSILVILLLRMALHQLPPASMAASSWLSLGPIATGALGMLVMGADAPAIFAAHGLAELGQIAAGIGVIGGVLFWGLGAWWLLLSVLITARYFRAEVPFNLGWWGFTFPLGVYAVATLKLGALVQLMFFNLLGVALVAVLGVVWAVVAARTLAGAYRGNLFVSPCIAELHSETTAP